MGKGELERISGGGRASMKTINRLLATSDNIGHTASLHFAQIRQSGISYVRKTLGEMVRKYVLNLKESVKYDDNRIHILEVRCYHK